LKLWEPGDKMTTVPTVLDREVYTEASAARVLRIAQATLHYWLEGKTTAAKVYKPVIREEATGSNRVTWAEFVESGRLRRYRRAHKVPMVELRAFIQCCGKGLAFPTRWPTPDHSCSTVDWSSRRRPTPG